MTKEKEEYIYITARDKTLSYTIKYKNYITYECRSHIRKNILQDFREKLSLYISKEKNYIIFITFKQERLNKNEVFYYRHVIRTRRAYEPMTPRATAASPRARSREFNDDSQEKNEGFAWTELDRLACRQSS